MPSTKKTNPPPTTAERKAERRREILEAAVRAFSRHGYHNCTMSRVAQEAGVADGTLYLYFQGKEDLLISAFRHVMESMLARVDEEVAQVADPVAKLRRCVELHLAFMEEDPELAAFLQFQLRQPEESIRREISGPLAGYARRVEAILDQGKAGGAFRSDVGTRLLRRVYFGSIDETVSAWLLRAERGPLSEKAAPLFDVLLHGMCAR
ncbi:MAG: TetR/AcrR family transcriptional regulator [Deltaproteobacteria bacterium]|nr:TetR/AcrR family transcriptional regulator [Deltaproteobacteria bacterium]